MSAAYAVIFTIKDWLVMVMVMVAHIIIPIIITEMLKIVIHIMTAIYLVRRVLAE